MTQIAATTCPVCLGAYGPTVKTTKSNGNYKVECEDCGSYVTEEEAWEDNLDPAHGEKKWPKVRRTALSHAIRTRRDLPIHQGTGLPHLTRDVLTRFETSGIALPIPTDQVRNIVRFLGNYQRSTNEPLPAGPRDLYTLVGAPSPAACNQLFLDIRQEGLIDLIERKGTPIPEFLNARLTLKGWRSWEAIGTQADNVREGFIAMQFGDDRLDKFVAEVIQAGIKKGMGCQVHRVDSPDKAQAGLIDNIMREAIQDASFVLVELSHGNKGAYWEAGFAEGLGKPVIYLCEKAIWDDLSTRPHFDVEHRTTIMWKEDEPEDFLRRLIPTIKNSLRRP